MNNKNLEVMPNNEKNLNSDGVKQVKKNKVATIIFVIIGCFIALILLFIVVFSVISSNSNKLICKSSEGNITIMYDDSTIVGYTASGIKYDLDQQRKLAEQIGVENYISLFNYWFETNTTGNCSVKKK